MNTIIFRLILLKARLKISILYASCTLMHSDARDIGLYAPCFNERQMLIISMLSIKFNDHTNISY